MAGNRQLRRDDIAAAIMTRLEAAEDGFKVFYSTERINYESDLPAVVVSIASTRRKFLRIVDWDKSRWQLAVRIFSDSIHSTNLYTNVSIARLVDVALTDPILWTQGDGIEAYVKVREPKRSADTFFDVGGMRSSVRRMTVQYLVYVETMGV